MSAHVYGHHSVAGLDWTRVSRVAMSCTVLVCNFQKRGGTHMRAALIGPGGSPSNLPLLVRFAHAIEGRARATPESGMNASSRLGRWGPHRDRPGRRFAIRGIVRTSDMQLWSNISPEWRLRAPNDRPLATQVALPPLGRSLAQKSKWSRLLEPPSSDAVASLQAAGGRESTLAAAPRRFGVEPPWVRARAPPTGGELVR